jgi:hypothetical protein
MNTTETLVGLVKRWLDLAADMERGDAPSRMAAYHLRFAADELRAHIGVWDD